MTNVLLLGAGTIGRMIATLLTQSGDYVVRVADSDPEALRRLALSLRFASSQDFTAALQEKMRAVRPIFQRIVSGASEAPPKTDDLEIFSDQKRASKALSDLVQSATSFHIAPRTRQIFRKLRPALLGWLAKSADPDPTLNQFVRLVEGYGLRSLFFELLVALAQLLLDLLPTLQRLPQDE